MKVLFLLSISFLFLFGKYMSNESCKECHEAIYNEFQSSYHSKSYFTDELHKKVADEVSKKNMTVQYVICQLQTI